MAEKPPGLVESLRPLRALINGGVGYLCGGADEMEAKEPGGALWTGSHAGPHLSSP